MISLQFNYSTMQGGIMATDCKASPIWARHGDKPRFELEWRIVELTVTELLRHGCRVYFDHDGGDDHETEITECTQAIMGELFACDEETLYVFLPRMNARRWVKFIYGNSGWDVISDYSSSLEPELTAVNRFVDQYA